MSDLKIIRDNFNAMIDKYEQEDVSVDDIDRKTNVVQTEANILANYFMDEVIAKHVPILDEEKKQVFITVIKDLVGAGVTIGQCGFLSMLADEKFMEELNSEQGTVETEV